MNSNPEKIKQELFDLSDQTGKALQKLHHLSNLEDIGIATTRKQAIYEEDQLVLYRYDAIDQKSRRKRPPILIVYALVNRPTMMDLQPDRSTIRGLLEAGLDVYLIDWGYPEAIDQFLTLDDYINGYIDRCVDVIRTTINKDAINILGVCQGGTFSLCYTSLHPDKVSKLVTMVTPVDFHVDEFLLSKWMRHIDVDFLVDTLGNIPGELLNATFLSLKPFRLTGQKYVNLIDIADNDEKLKNFMRMEKWIFDSPDQAGYAFREFVNQFFRENNLTKGKVKIGTRTVDLVSIHCPILNIFASTDHLVPPAASKALKAAVNTRLYEEIEFQGGHIGIFVSGKAQQQITAAIGQWIRR